MGPDPPLVLLQHDRLACYQLPADERIEIQESGDEAIIERQDSESTACVKIAKVPLGALGVDQDSGNKKPREYKKKIHPAPAVTSQRIEISIEL